MNNINLVKVIMYALEKNRKREPCRNNMEIDTIYVKLNR